MGKYKDLAVAALVQQLEAHGRRIVQECLTEADYQNRTYNLHDSYGWGVYANGKLVNMSTAPKEASALRKWYGKPISGHDEIDEFLKGYVPTNTKTIELVIAAAMPYAQVLENGGGGIKRKYKVISMSYDKLMAIAEGSKIPLKVRRIVQGQVK